tara:strand:+ start:148 stop:492 length:345 start_codon:yes stop_codon:yes gene_type:complete
MKHFKTIEEYPEDFKYINDFYILIKGLYKMDYKNRHNAFYFYLDFIGYTKDRTKGITFDLLPYRANECFGHLERCSFMKALKVFKNYSYEDVYSYIDLLNFNFNKGLPVFVDKF